MRNLRVLVMAALAGLTACAVENPTDAGDTLLPGGVRTFEVILDPARYLVLDTSFTGFTRTHDATFRILASDFQGVFDANVVAEWQLPRTITVFDSAGISRIDSFPRYFSGRILLAVDTLRSTATGTARLRLFRLAEDFDGTSVTWTHRVDTAGTRVAWTQPGGTRGVAVFDTVWPIGTDSIAFNVDSATMAAWADTTGARGAILVAETPGTRLRLSDVVLRAEIHSNIDRDTTVSLSVRPSEAAFIFDPRPPANAVNTLFVGGSPAWRSALQLRTGLDTLRVPCPDGPPGCTIQLSDATISRASLLLQPVASPLGFAPEDSVRLGARELLVTDFVPLQRAPLGNAAGSAANAISRTRFLPGQGQGPIELPITEYIAGLAADSVARRPEPYLALVTLIENDAFGFGAFAALPRLRLLLTVVSELQLR